MNHLIQHWCRKIFFSQYVIKLKYICWIIHIIINLKILKYWTWKSHFYYFSARLPRKQQPITTILAQIVVKNTRWMQVWYNKNNSNFVSYIYCTKIYYIYYIFSCRQFSRAPIICERVWKNTGGGAEPDPCSSMGTKVGPKLGRTPQKTILQPPQRYLQWKWFKFIIHWGLLNILTTGKNRFWSLCFLTLCEIEKTVIFRKDEKSRSDIIKPCS